jgi:hypothetical protein
MKNIHTETRKRCITPTVSICCGVVDRAVLPSILRRSHCLFFILILCVLYSYFIRILFVFYSYFMRILFVFYAYFICILFVFYLYFICILFVFYLYFICILFVFYSYFIRIFQFWLTHYLTNAQPPQKISPEGLMMSPQIDPRLMLTTL